MNIKLNYGTSKKDAVRKIDRFLDELMKREFHGGVKIKKPSKEWDGNTMRFSFKAKKGILGIKIFGTIKVTDDSVLLLAEIPGLVKKFVSEDKIGSVISEQFNELFGIT